jgi:hypothetical protein
MISKLPAAFLMELNGLWGANNGADNEIKTNKTIKPSPNIASLFFLYRRQAWRAPLVSPLPRLALETPPCWVISIFARSSFA